jgi:hypothetical protein
MRYDNCGTGEAHLDTQRGIQSNCANTQTKHQAEVNILLCSEKHDVYFRKFKFIFRLYNQSANGWKPKN